MTTNDGDPSAADAGHAGHTAFDGQWWEEHYQEAGPVSSAPSPHLVAELTDLPAGRALDVGCGTGADAIWLAEQGWEVTGLDISPTAVEHAERAAQQRGPEIAGRIRWVVADLSRWDPPEEYDLVVSQYVHPDVPFAEFVARLAQVVTAGGTLFVAGHDHADDHSAAHAPQDVSIGPQAVVSSLDRARWVVEVAETRTREVRRGSTELAMADVVVKARRR